MDLILFAIWCFAVAVAGGLVGLVLGNLRLPATLVAASGAAAGAGANLAISAIAAATAAAVHIRAGRINWRLFMAMAPSSTLGAVAGGLLGGELPDTALLLFIAAVLLYSSWDLARWRPGPKRAAAPDAGQELDYRAAILAGGLIGARPRPDPGRRRGVGPRSPARLAADGPPVGGRARPRHRRRAPGCGCRLRGTGGMSTGARLGRQGPATWSRHP